MYVLARREGGGRGEGVPGGFPRPNTLLYIRGALLPTHYVTLHYITEPAKPA